MEVPSRMSLSFSTVEVLSIRDSRVLRYDLKELGTRVMYHRPKDPNKFLLEVLGTLQSAQGQGTPVRMVGSWDMDVLPSGISRLLWQITRTIESNPQCV